MKTINLSEKFSAFSDHWRPRIIADLNENHLKLVKVKGDFIWHHHQNEDELFVVIRGTLLMDYRDQTGSEVKTIAIHPGEVLVVPKGVEHRPHSDEEAHIMLVEPKTVINTGEVESEMTKKMLERI